MEIPNIFKNRTGAIQLSDLDDNFTTVKVSVNSIDSQISVLNAAVTSLNTQIANFSAIPIGCIIIWSGNIGNIPTGWRLCDGTNNTPDLRDKFVIGAKLDSNGPKTTITGQNTSTGGSKDAVAVYHDHTATSTAGNVSTDQFYARIRTTDSGVQAISGDVSNVNAYGQTFNDNSFSSENNENQYIDFNRSHNHTFTVDTTVNGTGTSGTNANLPPYYALAYIMKI